MPQLWFVPASNDPAFDNIPKSLSHPVSAEVLAGHRQAGPCFAWGTQPGESNDRKMALMAPGDVCLFYTQHESGKPKAFYWAGVVRNKTRSAELSRDIWGSPEFEHVYFLTSAWPIEMTLDQYAAATGYEAKGPTGIFRANDEVVRKLIEKTGGLEEWARSFSHPGAPAAPSHPEVAASAIEHIVARISATGFHFDSRTIRAFHASLQSKPFVILAGNSGTGKSRLARHYAECFGATMDNRGFHMIAVRPDWNDGSELVGYTDLENNFRPGRLVESLLLAHAFPGRPFFVCLDEMNLARVEHYFSDFLSVVESRRSEGGAIVTDPLLRADQVAALADKLVPEAARDFVQRARREQRDLGLPANLFIVGTVNMDETTHPFSRKVLDRANTLELNAVSLRQGLDATPPPAPHPEIALSEITPRYVRLVDVLPAHRATAESAVALLEKLNAILSEAGLDVGYRVRDEATIFLVHAAAAGLTNDEAEECVALQKVLPRVHGSSPRLDRVLQALLSHFVGADAPDPNGDGFVERLSQIRREHPSRAARKVAGMWLLFREENFTSFWIA